MTDLEFSLISEGLLNNKEKTQGLNCKSIEKKPIRLSHEEEEARGQRSPPPHLLPLNSSRGGVAAAVVAPPPPTKRPSRPCNGSSLDL